MVLKARYYKTNSVIKKFYILNDGTELLVFNKKIKETYFQDLDSITKKLVLKYDAKIYNDIILYQQNVKWTTIEEFFRELAKYYRGEISEVSFL